MKTVSKGKLKAKMLEYFRGVEQTGEGLIVTSNGKPVLQVTPVRPERSVEQAFGEVRGKVKYSEKLTTPTTDEWTEV